MHFLFVNNALTCLFDVISPLAVQKCVEFDNFHRDRVTRRGYMHLNTGNNSTAKYLNDLLKKNNIWVVGKAMLEEIWRAVPMYEPFSAFKIIYAR